MSLIKTTAALAAGQTDTAKDTKVSQILGLRLRAASIPLVETGVFNMSDLVIWLKKILVSTKLTTSSKSLIVNMNLFELIKQSTDYKGMCRGSIVSDGTLIDMYIPIIQSNGQLGDEKMQMEWQIDLVNNTALALQIDYFGTSLNKGDSFIEYMPNTLENQLIADIPATFNKILIENTFNKVDAVVGGLMQQFIPEDSQVITNLDDEVVIGMDVTNAATNDVDQKILYPSDAGSFKLNNVAPSIISQLRMYRLPGGAIINYSTATLVKA